MIENILVVSCWAMYSILHWGWVFAVKEASHRCTVGWTVVSILFWLQVLGKVEPSKELWWVVALIFFGLLSWPVKRSIQI